MAGKIGIIGCGNISATYLSMAPKFKGLTVVACADLLPEAAAARGKEFGVDVLTVDELLAREDISAVVNLTIPAAHYQVAAQALAAGKHVYTEKPLALSVADGIKLKQAAADSGLKVGCAPDTFLGGAHQAARSAIDEGKLGSITAASCNVCNYGMEHWHPNPDFFYQPGGGPILDLGPYYIANLINLLGPVKRVAAMDNKAWEQRTIVSEPRKGEKLRAQVQTTYIALLEFAGGSTVTFTASWDVFKHNLPNMQLYGTEGSLNVPDPNFFNGTVELSQRDGDFAELTYDDHPFGVANLEHEGMKLANWRTAGLADMMQAIEHGREFRCNLDLALHTLEVMTAIIDSGADGAFKQMQTTCVRPQPMSPADARELLVV